MSDAAAPAGALRPTRALRGALGLLLVAGLGMAWFCGRRVDLRVVLEALGEARGWGPVAFVGLYALLSLLVVPTVPLNLGAGILWGPLRGGLYSAAGATLGGAGAFLLARHLVGSAAVHRWTGGRWSALQEDLERSDWKVVAFTRLSPVFPTGVLNYCYGLTAIRFTTFVWSTFLFLLPGSVLFAGLGNLAGQVSLAGEPRRVAQAFLLVSAAATGVVALRWLVRRRNHDFPGSASPDDGQGGPNEGPDSGGGQARASSPSGERTA